MYTFIYPSHPSHLINIINIYIWWKINFLSICWLLQWCIYLIIWFMSILVVWRWYHKFNCYLDWRGNSNFQNEHTIDRNQTKFQFKKKKCSNLWYQKTIHSRVNILYVQISYSTNTTSFRSVKFSFIFIIIKSSFNGCVYVYVF